jgi:selenide,water dikinase
MTTSAKKRVIDWAQIEPAVRQMATLNAAACEAMVAAGVRACTDVTGFGLIGHGRNVAKGSGVTLRIESSKVPVFPGAYELAKLGHLSGGSKRGRTGLKDEVRIGAGVDATLADLFFDAETSGGLLMAIAPSESAKLEAELTRRGVLVREIGEFVANSGVWVEVV